VPSKNHSTDEQRPLRKMLQDESLWAAAAEVIRSKMRERSLTPKQIEDKLSVSQSTVSRFLGGDPNRRALLKNLEGLNQLLEDLGLTVEALEKLARTVGLLLCIDRPNEGFVSTECASIHFHAAGDHAVPFPMDPRSDKSQTTCRFCGGPLSAVCPACQARGVRRTL